MSGEILTLNSTRHSEFISESPRYSKPFENEKEKMLKQVQHDEVKFEVF